jgi:hypothetical protein
MCRRQARGYPGCSRRPRATRRDRKQPGDADIEHGLRERAVSDPRAAEILLRWLQRPRGDERAHGVDLEAMSEAQFEALYAGPPARWSRTVAVTQVNVGFDVAIDAIADTPSSAKFRRPARPQRRAGPRCGSGRGVARLALAIVEPRGRRRGASRHGTEQDPFHVPLRNRDVGR